MINVRQVSARSVLNKSKIFDYCLNPFTGCAIGCVYCYARLFIGRYSGHHEAWGQFVDVKVNAPQVLQKQLQRARRGVIWISSVCDPYQPLEARFEVTRRCLEVLKEAQFPLNIQTKSELALRDIDLFQEFDNIQVGFTVTTDDEHVARAFEPRASTVRRRIEALAKLQRARIRTFAFIGPILPGNPDSLVERLEGTVDRILVDRMNYLPGVKGIYRRLGLEEAAQERFFQEYKHRIISALQRRHMAYEVFF
jgi:DNA repair photolyase